MIDEGKRTAQWPDGTPGSVEAVGKGCLCAIQDNGHGAGSGYRDDNGDPAFWITEGCPLHTGEVST